MIEYDVLVIGGGLAGMSAALHAGEAGASVAMVSKVYPTRSHSAAAQGGINAALGIEDSWEVHAYETVKGSDFLGDQDAIEILCRDGIQDVFALEHWGVIFDRNEEGNIHMRGFGGTDKSRTCHVGDMTGQTILHVMYERLLRMNVKSYDEWFVTTLLMEEGACCGAVAMDITSGKLEVFKAKAVIICTGGCGRVYEPSTNGLIVTGDGLSLAYRVGALLMDMEMVQYHPTTLPANGFLITEGARGEGAYLLNSEGERFMQEERYGATTLEEKASRDVVSRAETIEIQEGRGIDGCVLLDCRHIKDRILEAFHQISELAIDYAGVDITQQPLPIRPGMHYMMGGIKTDIDGRCYRHNGDGSEPLPGLYSAGEAACVSAHGANRLGGNSLLDCVTFGRKAGVHAAEYASSINSPNISEAVTGVEEQKISDLFARSTNERAPALRLEMGEIMHTFTGVFREEAGLLEAQRRIHAVRERFPEVSVHDKGRVFNTDLLAVLELDFMFDCAETIIASALARKESRGAHTRTDYPERDDENWLKHVAVYHTPDGPVVTYLPVTITKWQPEARQY
ncbi:FAD-binding protein [Candidatus Poribacteria bacterium]|nr:FAD-binding protein [Candidatus Poribacteria bacterium]